MVEGPGFSAPTQVSMEAFAEEKEPGWQAGDWAWNPVTLKAQPNSDGSWGQEDDGKVLKDVVMKCYALLALACACGWASSTFVPAPPLDAPAHRPAAAGNNASAPVGVPPLHNMAPAAQTAPGPSQQKAACKLLKGPLNCQVRRHIACGTYACAGGRKESRQRLVTRLGTSAGCGFLGPVAAPGARFSGPAGVQRPLRPSRRDRRVGARVKPGTVPLAT